MSQPTRVEPGTRHVLAWCTSCPPWRQLRGDRGGALRAAAEHVERCHPELRGVAADLREQARHADRRRNPAG